MSTQEPRQPTEDELRAAYEAELKRLHVDDVLIQTIVSLLNLGGRKGGLAPGTEDERDAEQLRLAIEGVRALLPLVEATLGPDTRQIRDALSQLQIAYARLSGGEPEGGDGPAGPPAPAEEAAPEEDEEASGAGPAQRSGRLWIPGQ